MSIDALLVNAALFLSLYLRFDGLIPARYLLAYRQSILFFTLACILCFYLFMLYNRLWQYASTGELLSIVGAVSAATLIFFIYSYFKMQDNLFPLPRSIYPLSWMLNLIFIGGSRFSWKLLRHPLLHSVRQREGGIPVLIMGAGDAGATLARELFRGNHRIAKYVPVGFVDDNPAKHKQKMFGIPVLGGRRDIPRLVKRYGVEEIIIAIPSATGELIRELVDICEDLPVKMHLLPPLGELDVERAALGQLRELRVEDLLDREPVQVDLEEISGYLAGRAILVTGAGGSIGAELCRQIIRFKPAKMLLLDHGENSMFDIHRHLKQLDHTVPLFPLVVDIKDSAAVKLVFAEHKPQVVFHAAAHKHVPLMEENPSQAVKNNILGTWHVAREALTNGTDVFVFISTDKAVNPSSIMGATKQVAEMLIQGLADGKSALLPSAVEKGGAARTRFAAVRFGNVLDSRGSVVPLFKEQIARGGPVTVTHPEMVRYFMTIPEAVQLVIQAGALVQGGEIFILDMGKPMKIVDLARRMIRLAGYRPDKDIKIVYTGIRPGEKLFEEIFTAEEGLGATRHERIYVAKPGRVPVAPLQQLLAIVGRPEWTAGREEVVSLLRTVIPAFSQDHPAAAGGQPGSLAFQEAGAAGSDT